MAKKAENGKITKIEKPYGGSTVKERKAAMSRGLTEEELKARNTCLLYTSDAADEL